MLELVLAYEDPPDPDFRDIVALAPASRPSLTLPSCGTLEGKGRVLCKRLEAAVVRHAGRVKRLSDLATALGTTLNRASGAAQAGNAAAARRQRRAAAKRIKQLRTALRAETKAGAKLAALLRSAGLTWQLTEAQGDSDCVDGSISLETLAAETTAPPGVGNPEVGRPTDAPSAPRAT